jgi:hypothetical protein
MYKLIIICVIFLIYKENPREMKIKKFNDFIGESFLDNSVFSRIGSIVSGKKEYSPSTQSAETEESPKNVGSQSSISSSTDTTKSSIGQKTSVSQGSFNLNTNKNAPLVVVFGGTDVGGKASGKYMYDYFTPDVLSKYNVFVANSSRISGNKAWKEIQEKSLELGLTPRKKILYLFSGGYLPAMSMGSSYDINKKVDYLNENFDKIFLVDIWIGKSGSAFYKLLAEKYGNKVEYYSYGGKNSGGGSNNIPVRNTIISKASKSHLTAPDHMRTNNEAIKSLKSQF